MNLAESWLMLRLSQPVAAILLLAGACGPGATDPPSLGTEPEVGGAPTLSDDAATTAHGTAAGPVDDAGPDAAGLPDAARDGGAEVAEPAPGPDLSGALYGLDHLVEVTVEMDPDDWDSLRQETRSFMGIIAGEDCGLHPHPKVFNTYPADVVIDGTPLWSVGIRKKGFFGSLSDTKPSLKIKTDTWVDDQELLGLRRITLNNNRQDPSHLNSCLAYQRFTDAGYPAPRCGFATVTVNGDFLGVYNHTESVKEPYLERHFGSSDGNLYEGAVSDFQPGMRGTFDKKNHSKANDWSDLDATVEALAIEGPGWLAAASERFDIDRFLTYWALEVLVSHWDGYSGNQNNFWLYADPADGGRFVFMPWGADSTFIPAFEFGVDSPFPPSLMAVGILTHRLYQEPTSRVAYQARLAQLLDTIWDEAALHAEVDAMAALVLPAMPEADRALAEADVPRIHSYIDQLRGVVLDDLVGGGPSWDAPLRESFCWAPYGEVDVTFTTSWGSHGLLGPFDAGTGEVTAWIDQTGDVPMTLVGATAGVETQGEGAGSAVIAIAAMRTDQVIEFLWLTLDSPTKVVTGSEVELDFEEVAGYRFLLFPPYDTEAVVVGWLLGGTLTFDDATPIPGATISGRLTSELYAPP